jgi:hypothetical protein
MKSSTALHDVVTDTYYKLIGKISRDYTPLFEHKADDKGLSGYGHFEKKKPVCGGTVFVGIVLSPVRTK